MSKAQAGMRIQTNFTLLLTVCAHSTEVQRRSASTSLCGLPILTHEFLERPICRQCTSGNRHDECKWDPAPLTKEEKLEARVRELEEQVEVSWERQRSANSPERRISTTSG